MENDKDRYQVQIDAKRDTLEKKYTEAEIAYQKAQQTIDRIEKTNGI